MKRATANTGATGRDQADEVVLVSDTGEPLGAADRTAVHGPDTPLHLAFSSHLFNSRGEVLITRRALDKKTWPGVWTNSCCGHPRPGELIEDAVRRRIREELGLTVGPITLALPDFRYRAVDASGIVENELCPVFIAHVPDLDPTPDPAEVAEWAWVAWDELSTAIGATPRVYSPWSVQQVPALAGRVQEFLRPDGSLPRSPEAAIAAVDGLLAREVDRLVAEWAGYAGQMGLDILPEDLPAWLRSVLVGRGKRLRVLMTYGGFVAAGGGDAAAAATMVRAAAALEALHLFALVQDDVMDESDSRRGRPSAHVAAAQWHREADGFGDDVHFGRNLAVLLGDLAHTLADRIVDDLPERLRRTWYALCVELLVGQRGDLTGAAARRTDRLHAEQVSRLKSGRYTVQRPLQLGAEAAGARPEDLAALSRFGAHLGQAFALRDDYLGIWGSPEETGKPAGDDLLEAKPTVLLSLARERLTGSAAELLDRLGTPDFGPDDVPQLAAAMCAAGIDDEVERLIAAEHAAALAVLDESRLDPAGIAGLKRAAEAVAWRST